MLAVQQTWGRAHSIPRMPRRFVQGYRGHILTLRIPEWNVYICGVHQLGSMRQFSASNPQNSSVVCETRRAHDPSEPSAGQCTTENSDLGFGRPVKQTEDVDAARSIPGGGAQPLRDLDGAGTVPMHRTKRWLTTTCGVSSAAAFAVASWTLYEFFMNDFSVGRTEWAMSRKVKKLIGFLPPQKASTLNSRYQLGLDEDLRDELALYFLQLDIDKPNGVRRTDALDLASKLGFSTNNKICGNFVQQGKGRSIECRRHSGCSLQEFGDLIEALILDEEASVDHKLNPEVDERSTQGNDVRSAGSNIYSEDSKRQEGADDASVNSSSSLQSHHETRERVLRLLKEENERANSTAWTSAKNLGGKQTNDWQAEFNADSDSDAVVKESIELQRASLERTLANMDFIKARRELSEAEKLRQASLHKELMELKSTLRELEYSSSSTCGTSPTSPR